MTQTFDEKLSALVDGELTDPQLIDELAKDQALQGKWQRYHLCRDLMRKETPAQIDVDLSSQIAAAIAQEPAIVAPKRQQWQSLPVVAQVLPLMRQGSQYALAASVAVAVILGVQQVNQPTPQEPFVASPNAALPGVQGITTGVSLEQSRPLRNADRVEQRQRINALLLDHQTQMRLKTQHKHDDAEQQDDLENPEEKQPE